MAPRKCCVPMCNVIQGLGVVMHSFPDPNKVDEMERFRTWVMKIGGKIVGEDNQIIHRNRKICHRHFEDQYTFPNGRLTKLAIPSLHIPGVHASSSRVFPMFVTPDVQVAATHTAPDEPSTSHEQGVHISSTRLFPMFVSHVTPDVQLASTHAALDEPSTSHKQVARLRKPMTNIERELRETLANTKAKLRKCQNAKQSFKTRFQLANKLMKTKAFEMMKEHMSPAAETFFQMQIKQFGKKPRGRRFSLEEKILALTVYKPSPKAYKLLSKICILPKRRTLDKMLRKIQLLPGINEILFDHLKKRVDRMPSHHRLCTVIFDEMAIAPGVSYDKTNDVIHGFIDNGIERQKDFCDHVLVFMIRGVIKKFKQPVSFSFCTGTTKTIDLKNQIENVIKKVMTTGLKVVSTVCDQGTTNLAALNLLINSTKATYLRKNIEYKGGFFELNEKKIYAIYDPPHLMKGICNNLMCKDLEYTLNGKVRKAKWAHLITLYRRGPTYKGVRLINKLTAQHVIPSKIPKMRVKYCTQVFSKNVGTAMGFMAGDGKLPITGLDTAELLLFFDKLFDSVNGNFHAPVKGKIYRSAVTPRSPHKKLWQQSLPVLKSMFYIKKNKAKCKVPSILSWIKTIEAFSQITKDLHSQLR